MTDSVSAQLCKRLCRFFFPPYFCLFFLFHYVTSLNAQTGDPCAFHLRIRTIHSQTSIKKKTHIHKSQRKGLLAMRLMSLISTTFANRVHATVLFLLFSVFCLLSVFFFSSSSA